MPGLAQQRNDNYQFSNATTTAYSLSSCSNGSVSSSGFWSKHRDDVSYNQLQKFWSELLPQARQELLRVDKQTLFEQARKNMYCSRCNGLLLEGFLQIVMYGKSLQQEGSGGHFPSNRLGAPKNQNDGDLCMTIWCHNDVQDPSVHPWGGLTTTRDGTLTLLDCYLYAKSLKGLQNVFGSARARERERELLYPDACGGGGRGWISQAMVGYGRGHGTRETCALHTARLSVDTLVDFWSALGEETQQSLLRMKEEDFIERLMYRFDSKRFCRDCRRNVIREFKELKELKRIRREPRCTSWFCVADTGFQYEVSLDTVQADWHRNFDTLGTYHHFEWAVGTGEGKSDILEFENVGLSARVQVNGLDLTGLNACYITLRAWKMDGRCTELSVKAHALNGQQCVHCRLVVGDGFVTITRGESIKRFFEHAEEAEEEEDDDSMDKDVNELDGECSRPQKHAKSPELAREFLLDAATVIFKEQVEKAFREGTARQNAHSMFVSLALKLLEERVHVACKEIITLEKQMKLLEEEEKEKREEEERKERRRAKEREKKLRRKERLREKEKEREKKCSQPNQISVIADVPEGESTPNVDEEPNVSGNMDLLCEAGEEAISFIPVSLDIQDEQILDGYVTSNMLNHSDESHNSKFGYVKDGNGSFAIDHSKYTRRKLKSWKEHQLDQTSKWSNRWRFAVVSESGGMISKSETRYHGDGFETSSRSSFNGLNKQLRSNTSRSNTRTSGSKYSEKLHCSHNRMNDRYDLQHSCSCYQQNDYGAKVGKSESDLDISKPYYRGNKYSQVEYVRENFGRPKSKIVLGNNASTRDLPYTKKVWEPLETQKKYPQSNSDSDVTVRSSTFKVEAGKPVKLIESSNGTNYVEINNEDNGLKESKNCSPEMERNCQNGFDVEAESHNDEVETYDTTTSSISGTRELSMRSNSNSDSCSSCLSEGDGNTSPSSNPQNPESLSTSDSEDASQLSEGKEILLCLQNGFSECHEVGTEQRQSTDGGEALRTESPGNLLSKTAQNYENGKRNDSMGFHAQGNIFTPLQAQSIHFPVFQAPSVGYYHQGPVSWPAAPASGLMPLPHPNHYVFASPFGYSLNGNSRFIQYGVGAVPHLTRPLLNPGQVPIYQPVPRTSGINPKEHSKISNQENGEQNDNPEEFQRVVPTGQHPLEALPNVGGQHGNSDKVPMGNTSFSLFHFGGPVALSMGFNSDTVPVKEEITGNLSSNVSADRFEGDHACSKKDAVEEYNLFAASNGIRFSIF